NSFILFFYSFDPFFERPNRDKHICHTLCSFSGLFVSSIHSKDSNSTFKGVNRSTKGSTSLFFSAILILLSLSFHRLFFWPIVALFFLSTLCVIFNGSLEILLPSILEDT